VADTMLCHKLLLLPQVRTLPAISNNIVPQCFSLTDQSSVLSHTKFLQEHLEFARVNLSWVKFTTIAPKH